MSTIDDRAAARGRPPAPLMEVPRNTVSVRELDIERFLEEETSIRGRF